METTKRISHVALLKGINRTIVEWKLDSLAFFESIIQRINRTIVEWKLY